MSLRRPSSSTGASCCCCCCCKSSDNDVLPDERRRSHGAEEEDENEDALPRGAEPVPPNPKLYPKLKAPDEGVCAIDGEGEADVDGLLVESGAPAAPANDTCEGPTGI